MSKEQSALLAQRLREVILDGDWVANTNLKALLSDVRYEQAIISYQNLNSIAALTFHVNYYIEGVLNVLEGGTLDIRDKYSFDLPDLTSEEDWKALTGKLWSNTEKFANCVARMNDEKLNEPFVDQRYGNYQRNIEGMIEHCYYHLGQVSLLKKLTPES